MGKELKHKAEELKLHHEKPVGIFGARASGKTIFFTVLYGLSGFNNTKDKFSVICDDDESRAYLKKNYRYLLDGKLPPRTEVSDITKINMSYFYNQNSYVLKSFDFAGELIKDIDVEEEEEVGDEFKNLQNKLYEFFTKCSGILIFVEPSQDKKEGFERQTEIDKLLGFLKDLKGKWDFNIPMGMVISKWDKVSNGTIDGNYEEEQIKVEDYVKNHDIYNNIHSLITGVSTYVKVFPVSAFGASKEVDLPPEELKPFNLFTPLVWISDKRDIEWQTKVINILQENIPEKDAKEIYEIFKDNVDKKDLVDEVEVVYKAFKAKKRNKKIILVSLISALVIAGGGYKVNSEIQKQNMYDKVISENNRREKIDKIDNFHTKYGLTGKKGKELSLEKKDAFYSLIDDKSITLEEKLDNVKLFIRVYLGTEEAVKMEEQRARVEREIELRDAFAELEKSLVVEKDKLKKHRICRVFINEYPDYKDIETIKERSNKLIRSSDREKYEEIENYSKIDIDNYSEIFIKIEDYLSVEEFKEYRKEINEIKANLKDEYLYKNLKNSMEVYNKEINAKMIKEVVRTGESYLSNNTIGRYEDRIKNILKQVETIKAGIDAELEFYIEDKTGLIKNKKVELKVVYGKDINILKKSNVEKNVLYSGSIDAKIDLNSVITVTAYIIDKNGKEIKLGPTSYKVEQMNRYRKLSNKSGKKINIELRTYINNFMLK